MKRIFFTLCLLLVSTRAAEIDIQDSLGKRPQPETYTATVVSTISGGLLKSAQKTVSTIYVKGTASRIETETPTKTAIITTGNRSWTIGPDGTATEIPREKTDLAGKTPAEILTAFSFHETQTQGDTLILTGIPKSTNPKELFSTARFSKIIITADKEKNTIREIQVFNKTAKISAQFLFTYTRIADFWMNQEVTTKIFIGKQTLTVSQIYSNISLRDIPDSLFIIPDGQGGK